MAPVGVGERALEWTLANDERLLNLTVAMKEEAVLTDAAIHHSACGPGAIVAAIGCAAALGARRGVLLDHVTSHQVRPVGPPADMVGYGAVIFVSS
jgi:AmmeMemoRadiSam system protein B